VCRDTRAIIVDKEDKTRSFLVVVVMVVPPVVGVLVEVTLVVTRDLMVNVTTVKKRGIGLRIVIGGKRTRPVKL
jgi:hypothetical protein